MEKTITGYQYAADNSRYLGKYTFPVNADSGTVHLPPCTVLDAPPAIPAGKAAFRSGNAWILQNDTAGQIAKPEITDYALLTANTIALLKSQGLWTTEDQAALDATQQAATGAAYA